MTATTKRTRVVFFDVDFTLIHPGPVFQGSGYAMFCERYGISVEPAAFERAAKAASPLLEADASVYDPGVFIRYTRRIIEEMGGSGPHLEEAARAIYEEWSACHHFVLYEDVPDVLRTLHASGLKIGLISNTQRCLASFQRHFALEGLFAVTLSSSDHGYMKPHPSIFEAALQRVEAEAHEALMVGDSLPHDVAGARSLGMRAVLVVRSRSGGAPASPVGVEGSGPRNSCPPDVPVIRSLRELPALL